MLFKDIVMQRYAAKGFNGKEIPQEKIDELFEMIRFSPTSFNLQPWKVKVITDQAVKESLQPHSWNQPQVSTCSHLFVFCANIQLEALTDKLEAAMKASDTPDDKVEMFVGMIRKFIANLQGADRLAWAQKQIYIALANGMNGATALGFDSCPMEGFDAKKYSEILNLPDDLIPTVLMPVGYTEAAVRSKLRFDKSELVID